MIRPILAATILVAVFAMPAFAGSPPVTSPQTSDTVAASCASLGPNGEVLASGTGCRNIETGAAVLCVDGQCKDYFADPRYKKIKGFLESNRLKPQQSPVRM